MSKKNSRVNKKTQLEIYLEKTHDEINNRAIETLKSLYKDGDMISIDDSIHPVLLLLSNQILGGNHETAVGMAASYKIAGLTTKSIQCGEIPAINIFDIGKALPLIQNIFSSLPLINSAVGSYIECIGKNMNAQCNEVSFNYGVAMNIGANCINTTKAPTLRSIGINIGNIIQCIDIDENHKQFLTSVKTLPQNKFTKRLKEYVESILPKKTVPSKIPETPLPIPKGRSSLKKEEQKDSDTLKIGVTGTKEDFDNAMKEISEKLPKLNVVKFSVEDDTAIVNKTKERKTKEKIIPKESTDEIRFATNNEE